MSKSLLTVQDVAKMTSVSERTVRAWTRSHPERAPLPVCRTGRWRRLYFDPDDVQRWLHGLPVSASDRRQLTLPLPGLSVQTTLGDPVEEVERELERRAERALGSGRGRG